MPCVEFHRHVWFPRLDSCYPIPCVVPIVSPWNPHQHPTKFPWNCHKKSMTWTELHLVAKIREALLSQTRLCRAPRGVVSDKGNNWEHGWSLCIYCNIWILHKYIYIYQYIYTHTNNYMCIIIYIYIYISCVILHIYVISHSNCWQVPCSWPSQCCRGWWSSHRRSLCQTQEPRAVTYLWH